MVFIQVLPDLNYTLVLRISHENVVGLFLLQRYYVIIAIFQC